MKMNKSAIAMGLAAAGVVAAPTGALAAEAYGQLNADIQSNSFDGGGATDAEGNAGTVIFAKGNDESGLVMEDNDQSEVGWTGSQDLGNGLTASYQVEFGFDLTEEDIGLDKRLGWIALGGDFGRVRAGNMFGLIYEYGGYNSATTCCNGYAVHYWNTAGLEDDPFGLRVDRTIEYRYGGGGYSSDPFTFSVQGRMADKGATDEETFDSVAIGAAATFGEFTVNAMNFSTNKTGTVPEPSLTTLGGRWNRGPWRIGATYYLLDQDNAAGTEPTSFQAHLTYDFGGGLTGVFSAGSGDADRSDGARDLSTYFVRIQQNLTSRNELYFEAEQATTDGTGAGGDDGETTLVSVGARHHF